MSFSKNGVVRIDGFSSPDQYDDEAMSLWTHENYEDDEIDIETSKYILDIIGDKFCQLVTSEKTALSWVKKDGKEVKYNMHSTNLIKEFFFAFCLICGLSPASLLIFWYFNYDCTAFYVLKVHIFPFEIDWLIHEIKIKFFLFLLL